MSNKRKTEKDYQTVAIDRNIIWLGEVLPRNNHTKTLWKCKNCGHEWEAIYHNFQKGSGCPECRNKKISKLYKGQPGKKGEDNPNWNHNLTDKEREKRCKVPGYTEWVYRVKEKDNFTCQGCGDKTGGNLVSHHLNSYRTNPDQRISLENGVCLCDTCHKNFHHQYGYGENTEEQFLEFKENF